MPVATCHQSKHITLEECYEAICKYDNVIMQENIRDNNLTRLNKIRLVDRQGHKPEGNPDTSYRSYKEWISLTPEQQKEIHKAREEAQAKGHKNWNHKKDGTDTKTEDKKGKGNEENNKSNNKNDAAGWHFKVMMGIKKKRQQGMMNDN